MHRAPVDLLPLWLALAGALACERDGSRDPGADSLATTDTTPADRYHTPPADTLDRATYDGWKQYRLVCDRCHGEDARGTTFGPDLLPALTPAGAVPDRAAFIALMLSGRPDRGMPPAATLGLSPEHFDGLYDYLSGRSRGRYVGGRPAVE